MTFYGADQVTAIFLAAVIYAMITGLFFTAGRDVRLKDGADREDRRAGALLQLFSPLWPVAVAILVALLPLGLLLLPVALGIKLVETWPAFTELLRDAFGHRERSEREDREDREDTKLAAAAYERHVESGRAARRLEELQTELLEDEKRKK